MKKLGNIDDLILYIPSQPKRIEYPSGAKRPNYFQDMVMKDQSVDERIEWYISMLHGWDERNHKILRNYTQFSHRLHWDENPFADKAKKDKLKLDKLFEVGLVYSFSNEHWVTTENSFNGTINKMDEDASLMRTDLYQIYWPKGTKSSKWIKTQPQEIVKTFDIQKRWKKRKRKPWSIMEFAYELKDHLREHHKFINVLYPCKNLSRNLAMVNPELIDPESWVFPGTGSFKGFAQIFDDEEFLMYKAKVDHFGNPENENGEKLLEQFNTLINHKDNPIKRHQFINTEDKVCFWYKFLSFKSGWIKQRKKIDYGIIFPEDFVLSENIKGQLKLF